MTITKKQPMFPLVHNFIIRKDMDAQDKKWLCPEQAKREERLNYLKSFTKPLPSKCPECGNPLTHDEDHIYCTHCGLITMASISYVAGQRIKLYGLLII